MKRSLLNKWIKALESDKYRQIKNKLGNRGKGRCCLGVLCDVAKVEYIPNKTSSLPVDFAVLVRMSDLGDSSERIGDSLAELNDAGVSFKEIAQILRERPTDFIREIT